MSVDDFPAPGKPDGAPVALAPPVAGVFLWWATLAASDAEVARVSGWLAPAEHARAARFGREILSRRYVLGRALLRWALGNVLGLPPPAVPIVRGARGRPQLEGDTGLDFNVSHTGGVALIGVLRTNGRHVRIGVDVECVARELGSDRLARKFLTAPERSAISGLGPDDRRRAFLRYWTCKEAMSKATDEEKERVRAKVFEKVKCLNPDGGTRLSYAANLVVAEK